MSHGANPVVAALFGLTVLLTAGIASADCSPTHSAKAQTPASDTTAQPTKPSGSNAG